MTSMWPNQEQRCLAKQREETEKAREKLEVAHRVKLWIKEQ